MTTPPRPGNSTTRAMAALLAAHMRDNQISRAAFAAATGRNLPSLTAILAGRQATRAETLDSIAAELGLRFTVTLDRLETL